METKNFLTSLTFWGAVVAVAGPLLAQFNILIPSEGLAGEVVSVIGGVLAIIGRFRATTSLTLK